MNNRSNVTKLLLGSAIAVCLLIALPGCERRDWQASQQDRKGQQVSTKYSAETATDPVRQPSTTSSQLPATKNQAGVATGATANKAVSLRILASEEQRDLQGSAASTNEVFLVLDTRWENIHPKEKVSKARLEGKADRTMGVGGLSGGGRSSEPEEFVDMDVGYKIPKLVDHIYALVDGRAVPLHPAMAKLPNGLTPTSAFGIAKQGETRDLRLAFLVPGQSANIALKVFDYTNGHLLIPIRGDTALASASDQARAEVLDRIETDVVDLATHRFEFADDYNGVAAGEGWQFAVVELGGQSVSSGGNMGNILQFDPKKYLWVNADGGYIYYAAAGSTDAKGNIRFTPEVYQQQEVAFRVPETADRLSMGLRINRDVVTLALTEKKPQPMPGSSRRHQDGDVMEVLLHGSRRDGDYLVLDLGINPLVKNQGLEVRTAQQFLLQTEAGELRPDAKATAALAGHPPEPFVVPPGVAVRFELAFMTAATPTSLRVRGFRGEGNIDL